MKICASITISLTLSGCDFFDPDILNSMASYIVETLSDITISGLDQSDPSSHIADAGTPITEGIYEIEENIVLSFTPNDATAQQWHLVIPDGVTGITLDAIPDTSRIVAVDFPESFDTLTVDCFKGSNISELKLGHTMLNAVYDGSCADCPNLAVVELPDTVELIYLTAFNNSLNLKHVNIPNGAVIRDAHKYVGDITITYRDKDYTADQFTEMYFNGWH